MYLTRNLLGISLLGLFSISGLLDNLQELSSADRLESQVIYPSYEKGNCDDLENLFRWHGMTNEESNFFFGRNIIWRESRCGLDTYNERTGDTGFCQLTHWHSKPGYYNGTYYNNGWAVELFGLYVGKAHKGIHKDHANIISACLWLLRGGNFEPGIIDTDPWNRANWS